MWIKKFFSMESATGKFCRLMQEAAQERRRQRHICYYGKESKAGSVYNHPSHS